MNIGKLLSDTKQSKQDAQNEEVGPLPRFEKDGTEELQRSETDCSLEMTKAFQNTKTDQSILFMKPTLPIIHHEDGLPDLNGIVNTSPDGVQHFKKTPSDPKSAGIPLHNLDPSELHALLIRTREAGTKDLKVRSNTETIGSDPKDSSLTENPEDGTINSVVRFADDLGSKTNNISTLSRESTKHNISLGPVFAQTGSAHNSNKGDLAEYCPDEDGRSTTFNLIIENTDSTESTIAHPINPGTLLEEHPSSMGSRADLRLPISSVLERSSNSMQVSNVQVTRLPSARRSIQANNVKPVKNPVQSRNIRFKLIQEAQPEDRLLKESNKVVEEMKKNITWKKLLRLCIYEFCGTALLALIISIIRLSEKKAKVGALDLDDAAAAESLANYYAFNISLGSIIVIQLATTSIMFPLIASIGANLNPLLTIAMYFIEENDKTQTWHRVIITIITQILGAITGTYLAFAASQDSFNTYKNENVSTSACGFAEFSYAFLLCFVFLNTINKQQPYYHSAYLKSMGLILTGAMIALGGITGGVINPALCIGADVAYAFKNSDNSNYTFWGFAYAGFHLLGTVIGICLALFVRPQCPEDGNHDVDTHSSDREPPVQNFIAWIRRMGRSHKQYSGFFCEFIGTYFIVLSICLSCSTVGSQEFYYSIGGGIIFAAYFNATWDICDGSYNPILSIVLFLMSGFKCVRRTIFYVLAQFLAGFAAAGTLWWFSRTSIKLQLTPDLWISSLVIEFLFTNVMIFCGLFFYTVKRTCRPSAGWIIGSIYAASGYAARTYHISFLNPAGSIGVETLNNIGNFQNQTWSAGYYYALAQLIGGASAAGYFFFTHKKELETIRSGGCNNNLDIEHGTQFEVPQIVVDNRGRASVNVTSRNSNIKTHSMIDQQELGQKKQSSRSRTSHRYKSNRSAVASNSGDANNGLPVISNTIVPEMEEQNSRTLALAAPNASYASRTAPLSSFRSPRTQTSKNFVPPPSRTISSRNTLAAEKREPQRAPSLKLQNFL